MLGTDNVNRIPTSFAAGQRGASSPRGAATAIGCALACGALLAAASPALAGTAKTTRVSVSSSGAQANGSSGGFVTSISAHGRFVAFESAARNLVRHDTNRHRDIFVRDLRTRKTRRVSVSSSGAQAHGNSGYPSISAGGRFVAFESGARNLVRGDTNRRFDIFVRDLRTGKTRRVSVSSSGRQANRHSSSPSISASGRFVAFSSSARNLVRHDTNRRDDVFVHDLKTGKTRRVSVSSSGRQAHGSSQHPDSRSLCPSISADGRRVAFWSRASNLVRDDTNDASDVFVHDLRTGKTRRVSVSSSGEQAGPGSGPFGLIGLNGCPSISADGRFVAFESQASNLVDGDTNDATDTFVHDLRTGKTSRVSLSSSGEQGNDDSPSGLSPTAAISADGRFVAFESLASNLVAGDTNDARDVFVHDLRTGETERVNISSSGVQGNQGNQEGLSPSISADGRFVAFYSGATNLVPGDTNDAADAFRRGPLRSR
jgi:Tol biopolymer transport system component